MAHDVFGIVGSVIAGAYRVEKVVAEGGFGVVYRAHHGGFRAPVALKCLKVPQSINDQYQAAFLEQFRAEAELMFRLSSSIATVVRPLHIDAMTTPDGSFVPFMVLEWLDGETLDAMIRQRKGKGEPPLPVQRLIKLLSPVARAVDKAHRFAGPTGPVCVVHRDLKPENIFVARVAGEEVVKILDFGIGKVKSVANQVAGRASQEAGGLSSFTPAYGSPEQWTPKKLGQTGPWTDVWGLALSMVEALVGNPVIDGDHQAIMGTVLDPMRRPTPRTEGVTVSDQVEAVFARALAVDPRERYSSVGQFWNELLDAYQVDEQGNPLAQAARGEALVTRASGASGAYAATRIQGTTDSTALDLEFDLGPASGPSAAVSERQPVSQRPLEIPDLDLAPSVPPARAVPSQKPAAPQVSSVPPSMRKASTEDLEPDSVDGGLELALDLPEDDAFRRRSSGSPPPPIAEPEPGRISAPPAQAAPREPSSPRIIRPEVVPLLPQRERTGSAPIFQMPRPPVLPVEEPSLVQKLVPGGALVAGSILLTIIDQAYSAATGEMLAIGPLRATWVAGLLLLGGLALMAYRALPRS